MSELLEIKAAISIRKPAHEVFDAIVDPAHMTHYFISRSNGRMEDGKRLVWGFPEFSADVQIRVGRVERERRVEYFWENEGRELCVEMILEPRPDGSTVVRITERGMPHDEAGLRWLAGNTEGWANFLACLKAYLEYGINLREGAFGFRFA